MDTFVGKLADWERSFVNLTSVLVEILAKIEHFSARCIFLVIADSHCREIFSLNLVKAFHLVCAL